MGRTSRKITAIAMNNSGTRLAMTVRSPPAHDRPARTRGRAVDNRGSLYTACFAARRNVSRPMLVPPYSKSSPDPGGWGPLWAARGGVRPGWGQAPGGAARAPGGGAGSPARTRDGAAGGAGGQAGPDQVGLRHLLHRALPLPDRDGKGGDADRPAAEAPDQRVQHGAVEPVQAQVVHVIDGEGGPGDRPVDGPVGP